MEVFARSSWFLLLLGFGLFAATLQESGNCPTPEQVSCTTGDKCNSDNDCDKDSLCCANSCYSKRCTSIGKGVQGDGQSDGPSETECRPFIEKALKQLEAGEATDKQDSSEDDNAEDIPTVEITDDSSHQETDNEGDRHEDDTESVETDRIDDKSTEQETPEAESKEEDDETVDDNDDDENNASVEKSEENEEEPAEKAESREQDESKEEQIETTKSVEEETAASEEVTTTSNEEVEAEVPEIIQITEEATIQKRSIEDLKQPEEEVEQKVESVEDVSAEKQDVEIKEDEETSDERKEDDENSEEKNEAKDTSEEKKVEPESEEVDDNGPVENKEEIVENDENVQEESVEVQALEDEDKSVEKPNDKSAEVEEEPVKCPPKSKVSCKDGEKCTTRKDCGEDEQCCPNNCYTQRCVPTSLAADDSEEDDEATKPEKEESAEEESEETEDVPCPSPDKLSCTDGEKCNKNRQCDKEQICCSNKCYTKRCIPKTLARDIETITAKQEAEKVEEIKSEMEDDTESEEDGSDCPQPEDVSCKEGEKCGRNRDCKNKEICCPNKCYTKRCTSKQTATIRPKETPKPKPQEIVKPIEKPSKPTTSAEESECPPPEEVSCRDGEKCNEDDDCSLNEICCSNHCYNKRCIPKPPGKVIEEITSKKPPVKKPEVKKLEARKIEIKLQKEKDEDDEIRDATAEELSLDSDIPTEVRPRDHVEHLLKLDEESSETENVINKVSEGTLKELKKLYESAIKPLEGLYKYRDLSNRHFGDAEIFSKPLVLFMGPWSGGKSSIINYLLNNEYNETSLRTGAEPSPAYFNILMHGEEPEIIDGTELAADFTFSGLQKFGQGLEERLRGVKLPTKLLEKVNIVEIPGILEVRKQVSRVFPFNDACQWFIDRADIIFLVYDPSKLDVGPETEAILDQLKGREHQTRIILNKADQVKPEELMRVQAALIWNISPLMSSPQPPVMYTTSLWSRPYEAWAPVRLLQAQERAFLRDLRNAVEKRIENKIASARRFAVRVRNHAKMVDCYLTTYYNHKSVFGNRKHVADEIIEHPQDYHIYEGLSTLTNISRYDLPDPEVYKDFFKLNPLYDFQQLSATCTYFRGCPINRLDIAIAYDLPELVGTHKRNVEEALTKASQPEEENPPTAPGS